MKYEPHIPAAGTGLASVTVFGGRRRVATSMAEAARQEPRLRADYVLSDVVAFDGLDTEQATLSVVRITNVVFVVEP